MPRSAFKNPFGRRRSSGNVLETAAESPEPGQTSSFKVLERPDKKITFDGSDRRVHSQIRVNSSRPFNSPLQQLRGKSAEDLGFGPNRGSGGTTNSGSSGYFDSSSASARYSSTSTLPSSLDQDRDFDDRELFPKKRATAPMHTGVSAAADDSLPPPPSFSSRASRAFSFGLKSKQHQQQALAARSVATPSLPASPVNGSSDNSIVERSPVRERAMTTSSYASTAVPPRLDAKPDLGTSDFGNDFGTNMFDSLKDRSSRESLPTPPVIGGFHRTESEPMFPPRSYSRQGLTPSPNQARYSREDTSSPYRYDDGDSQEGLYSTSSALSSPRMDVSPGLPPINNNMAPAFLGGSKPGYSLVPERYASPGPERLSQDSRDGFVSESSRNYEPSYMNRQAQLDDGDRWGKKYQLKDEPQSTLTTSGSFNSFKATPSASATGLKPQGSAVAGASRAGAISPGSSEGGDLFTDESRNATPRATRLVPKTSESLFDASPSGAPSRAIRPTNKHQRTESGTPKKMTKAQFEMLQKHGNSSSAEQSEDDTHSGDEYDDEDESERAKKVTTQRRKQEANMAVYRQQMKKVTGGGPSDLPNGRPGYDRAGSTTAGMSGLHLGGIGGAPPTESFRGKHSDDDEDEDVPLGILQAHGFPSGSRPPTQAADGGRSVVNGGAGQGNLPPFARRLPADPYFGAGLVNPANRESLAFGGAGSVYGSAPTTPMGNPMPVAGGHPGGLVGVIASEETAKAARRANPNAGGGYGPIPLPNNMMPQMPRTMSMGNLAPPSMHPGGMPPMPQTPMMPGMQGMPMMGQQPDATQQMQQFMQMQMQMMQNMMAMQQSQMQPQMQQPPQGSFLAPHGVPSRPMSMVSHAPSFHSQGPGQGRAMTMLQPPSNWGNMAPQQRPTSSFHPQQGGYAPSVHGMNMGGGPGAGYTPSIAPSERSNIGMPSRYRPVQTGDGSARSQSMTSSMTLNAFQNQQPVPQQQQAQQAKSTIRVIEKPKGAPKVSTRAVNADDDDDDGWAEMAKKRNENKFRWGRKKEPQNEPALSDLYQSFD